MGFDQSDDAGVYRIGEDVALVQTVDFFTPMVDDPFTFGQIAAANALSDVYAMGGRPLTALAIVCYPQDGDLEILGQVMRGGLDKMREANCTVVGGHSVRDAEMKFGYAVTGLVDPGRVYTNAGAQPGDILLLTKPIGTGVITTAMKQGKAEEAWVESGGEVDDDAQSACRIHCFANQRCACDDRCDRIRADGARTRSCHGEPGGSEIETAKVPRMEGALDAIALGRHPWRAAGESRVRGMRGFAESVERDP